MNGLLAYRISLIFSVFLSLTFVCFLEFLLLTPTVQPKQKIEKVFGKKKIESKQVSEHADGSLTDEGRHVAHEISGKKKCDKPVSQFVYVKTHKTGSTTTMEILNKYIGKYNLSEMATRAYPGWFVGGYPGRFKCKFMVPKGSSINIQHTRFDAVEMKNFFHPNTRYFTIVREPWRNFMSAYHFFSDEKKTRLGCSGMPKVYIKRSKEMGTAEFLSKAAVLLNSSVPFYFRFRNYQSHDLGIDPMLDDDNKIQSQIEYLDKNMDLVMLLEYFDESLILLKDLLCFDWSVLSNFGHTNKLHYDQKTLKDKKEKKNFQQLYNIDISLYDHFNRTFWKRVDEYGRGKMARDLEILRSKQNKRPIWTPKWRPRRKIDFGLRTELENYMHKNSGKCFYLDSNKLF